MGVPGHQVHLWRVGFELTLLIGVLQLIRRLSGAVCYDVHGAGFCFLLSLFPNLFKVVGSECNMVSMQMQICEVRDAEVCQICKLESERKYPTRTSQICNSQICGKSASWEVYVR